MSPAAAPRYQVFISCSDADRPWVRGKLLRELNLAPESFITADEFRPGSAKADEFERAVTQSQYTLLVLTAAYLASEWNQFSDRMAIYASVESGQNRVIPILREPVAVPLQIRYRLALDCVDPAKWDAEFARLRDFLSVPAPAVERIPSPYPGMTPYGVDGAAKFFGRDKEIGDLATLLKWQNFLIVVGASGCGKSSLVFAGLAPRLASGGQWLIRNLRPGSAPMAELAAQLEAPAGEKVDWAAAAGALLRKEKRERLLLVVDQLEESFSLDKPLQSAFLAAIRSLKRNPDCVALMTMRADFFESLLKSELAPIDASEQFNLSPLRGASLREAIVKPAESVGVYVEHGLIERLFIDAGDEPGVLPALQETMVMLWEKMERRLLTEHAYQNLDPHSPGIGVALALRGQAALAGLTESQRIVAKRILLRLINFGEGRADTRRRQLVGELRSAGDDAADFQTTLDQLARNRIVTLDSEGSDKVRADLAHECLIAGWPTLRGWVESRRDAETKRRRLGIKAEEWVRLGGKKGGLLDKVQLQDARSWIDGPDGAELGVDNRLKDLVEASRNRLRREFQQLVLGVAAAVVGVLGIAIMSWNLIPQLVADQAHDLIQHGDPDSNRSAVQKALLAVRLHDMGHTREVLHETVQAMEHGGRFPPGFEATAAAFSEDGTQLGGVSAAGEIIIVRDPDGQASQTLPAPDPSVALNTVAFRPDQRELAAGAVNGSVILWDLASGSHRAQGGHTEPVTCIAYNRSGNLLATGSQDSTILIRDAKTLETKVAPLKSNGHINRLAFSPDGKYLAAATGEIITTTSSDGGVHRQYAAKLWDAASGALVRDFLDHKRAVTGVAFSANGESLATSSADGRLRIWDLRNLQAVPPAKELSRAHDASFGGNENGWMTDNAFSDVTFTGDGRLASAPSVQNFAEIWDIKSGKPQYRLLGHEGGIRALAFSGAGGKHKLATVGADHKIRLYYLETPDLVARAKLLVEASQAGPLGSR